MNEIVPNLGRDRDFIPLIRERFGDQFFTQSISVRIGCIEQSNSEIECLVHQCYCFAFGKISPPTGGDGPQTKANFADR